MLLYSFLDIHFEHFTNKPNFVLEEKMSFIYKGQGTFCEACLQEFHIRNRLFTHLPNSSKRCRTFYSQYAFRLDDAELQAIEELAEKKTLQLRARGFRRTSALGRPPFRLRGPLLALAVDLGISHSHLLKCKPHFPSPTTSEEDEG